MKINLKNFFRSLKPNRESLIPKKGGYPITIKSRADLQKLEQERIPVRIMSAGIVRKGFILGYNPFLAKGATAYIRKENEGKEKELDALAESLSTSTSSLGHAHHNELEKRAKEEEALAIDTYLDNERRGSDPTGNPTWIMRHPKQGKDDSFK